jgi:hypothetical protein
MPFPRGTKIFGFALGDIRNNGTPELIGIDDFGRLRIMTKDRKSSWTSRDHFGGTNNFYDIEAKKNLMNATKSTLGSDFRVFIPARILIKDLAGNGLNEVIVNKNISSTTSLVEKTKFFEKGEIYGLVWDGDALATNWKTKELSGYVSDFQIKDVDNDGEEELVVAAIDLGSILTRKGVSRILFFKLF